MNTKSSGLRIQSTLRRLERHIAEVPSGQTLGEWTARLNDDLEQLERALGEEASQKSQYFRQTARDHPRLLTTFARFHDNSLELLQHATVVVRLSAGGHASGTVPLEELRKATTSLISAVKWHEQMASELATEASHDIGGEG
jgi:hypothetical protein